MPLEPAHASSVASG